MAAGRPSTSPMSAVSVGVLELAPDERFEEFEGSAEGSSNELEVLAGRLHVGDVTDREPLGRRRSSERIEHHKWQRFCADEAA